MGDRRDERESDSGGGLFYTRVPTLLICARGVESIIVSYDFSQHASFAIA